MNAVNPAGVEMAPVEVVLALHARQDGALVADLTFTNRAAHPYRLLKWLTFPTGRIDADRFDVRIDGHRAAYTGMMKKRRPPGPDDFGLLQPGYRISATVVLNGAYDLSQGHELSVTYADVNPPAGERSQAERLRSNTVTLRR